MPTCTFFVSWLNYNCHSISTPIKLTQCCKKKHLCNDLGYCLSILIQLDYGLGEVNAWANVLFLIQIANTCKFLKFNGLFEIFLGCESKMGLIERKPVFGVLTK